MGGSPGCVGKLWHGNVSNVFGYQRKFCGTSQGKQYNSELVVFPHVTSSLSRNFLRMPLTIVLLHIVLALRICRCACCIACHIGPGCRLTFPLPGLRFGERSLCAPSEFGLARSEGNPSSPHGQLVSCGGTSGDEITESSSMPTWPPPMSLDEVGKACGSVSMSLVHVFLVWVPRRRLVLLCVVVFG